MNSKLLKKEFGFLIPQLLSFHPVSNAPVDFHIADEWGYFTTREGMDYPDCATAIGIAMFSNKKEKQEWIKYVREQAPHLQERARKRELEGK